MRCKEILEKAVYHKIDQAHHPERLEEIDAYRVVSTPSDLTGASLNTLYILGGRGSNLCCVIHDADTGKFVSEDSFKEKNSRDLYLSIIGSLVGVGIPWLAHELLPKQRVRRKLTKNYWHNVGVIRESNMKDLEESVKDIKLYQLPAGDVSKFVGKELELVDTKKPETYLCAEDSFWLRVRAHELGADAVVAYNPGSSIGTPIRFKR